MTAVAPPSLRLVPCRGTCPSGPSRAHHDRLLAVDTDPDVLLELVQLAVTWHELDYTAEAVVPPAEWETFAQRHHWAYPERAEMAFMLASDIVNRDGARSLLGLVVG